MTSVQMVFYIVVSFIMAGAFGLFNFMPFNL